MGNKSMLKWWNMEYGISIYDIPGTAYSVTKGIFVL